MRNVKEDVLKANASISGITDLALLGKEYKNSLRQRREYERALADNNKQEKNLKQTIEQCIRDVGVYKDDKEKYIKDNISKEVDRIKLDASASTRQDLADTQKAIEDVTNDLPKALERVSEEEIRQTLLSDENYAELTSIKDDCKNLISQSMTKEFGYSANQQKRITKDELLSLTDLSARIPYYNGLRDYIKNLNSESYSILSLPYTNFNFFKTADTNQKSRIINRVTLTGIPAIALSFAYPPFGLVTVGGALGYMGFSFRKNLNRSKEYISAFNEVKLLIHSLAKIDEVIDKDVQTKKEEVREQIRKDFDKVLAELKNKSIQLNNQIKEIEDRAEREINRTDLIKRLGSSFEENILKFQQREKVSRESLAKLSEKIQNDALEYQYYASVTKLYRMRIENYYMGKWENPPKLINENFFYNFDAKTEEQNLLSFEGDALAWVYKEKPYLDSYHIYRDSIEVFKQDLQKNTPLALQYNEYLNSKRLERAKTVLYQIAGCVHPDCIQLYVVDLQGGSNFSNLNTLNRGKTRYFPISSESSQNTTKGEVLGYTDLITKLSLEMNERINSEVCIKFNNIKEYNKYKIKEGSTTMDYKILVMYNYKQEWLIDNRFEKLVRNAEKTGIIPIVFIDYNDLAGNVVNAVNDFSAQRRAKVAKPKLNEVQLSETLDTFLTFFEDKPTKIVYTEDKVLAGKQFEVPYSKSYSAFYKDKIITNADNTKMIMYLNQFSTFYKAMYKYLQSNKG